MMMKRYWRCLLSMVLLIPLLMICFYLHPVSLLFDKQNFSNLMEEAEKANSKRVENLKRVCKSYSLGRYRDPAKKISFKHPPAPQYTVFYISKKDKVAYCPLYKAASTTWLYNLCLLGGYKEEQLDKSKEQLSTLARKLYPEMEFPEAKQALDVSMKLLVVRHPFERLVSAYRDKLENTNINKEHGSVHFYKKYGARIVSKYRRGGAAVSSRALLRPGTYYWDPERPQPTGSEPTFAEFVRYLLETDLVYYSDDHWIPYYLFCTPCLVDYELVGKVETLERDQRWALERLGLARQLAPRWQHRAPSLQSPSLASLYFAQLTRKQIKELYNKYKLDFELFDYSIHPYLEFASN